MKISGPNTETDNTARRLERFELQQVQCDETVVQSNQPLSQRDVYFETVTLLLC